MNNDFLFIERKPTVEAFMELREQVGWGAIDREYVHIGLENSLFAVCAIKHNRVVGTARVVGDGSICFYVQDVMVDPSCQKIGIGKALMERVMSYIGKNACDGAGVGLMAAKGKEEFYEKFGFWKRPNEKYGFGMMQLWKKRSV